MKIDQQFWMYVYIYISTSVPIIDGSWRTFLVKVLVKDVSRIVYQNSLIDSFNSLLSSNHYKFFDHIYYYGVNQKYLMCQYFKCRQKPVLFFIDFEEKKQVCSRLSISTYLTWICFLICSAFLYNNSFNVLLPKMLNIV